MTNATSPPVLPGLSSDQNALLTQLVTGPSIREVATHALQPALKALYPNLHIDPRLAMVVMRTRATALQIADRHAGAPWCSGHASDLPRR